MPLLTAGRVGVPPPLLGVLGSSGKEVAPEEPFVPRPLVPLWDNGLDGTAVVARERLLFGSCTPENPALLDIPLDFGLCALCLDFGLCALDNTEPLDPLEIVLIFPPSLSENSARVPFMVVPLGRPKPDR
mmetsp:Transcript_45904/g.86124  ORF Transcript_45904/g.86124 Transcript_45904/m.86124 type:complete len:130 (+) Transcript_45904:253-642(+)